MSLKFTSNPLLVAVGVFQLGMSVYDFLTGWPMLGVLALAVGVYVVLESNERA